MIIRVSSKFQRTDTDGTVFDSEGEFNRWKVLQLRQRALEITNLRRQVPYPLIINNRPVLIRSKGYPNGRAVVWVADFVYAEIADNDDWPLRDTAEDYKGWFTAESRLKIAVVEAIYNIRVKITGPGNYRSAKPKRRLEDYLNA